MDNVADTETSEERFEGHNDKGDSIEDTCYMAVRLALVLGGAGLLDAAVDAEGKADNEGEDRDPEDDGRDAADCGGDAFVSAPPSVLLGRYHLGLWKGGGRRRQSLQSLQYANFSHQ